MLTNGSLSRCIEFIRKLTRKGPQADTFRSRIRLLLMLKYKMKVVVIGSRVRVVIGYIRAQLRCLLQKAEKIYWCFRQPI